MTPITRHQRELCNLAIVIAQQQDTIDGLQAYLKRLHDAKEELVKRTESLTEERTELLTENASLRTELETVRKPSDFYQAQSLEFCAKCETEAKRADDNFQRAMAVDRAHDEKVQTIVELRRELNLRREATEDDLRTIAGLRAEVKKLRGKRK